MPSTERSCSMSIIRGTLAVMTLAGAVGLASTAPASAAVLNVTYSDNASANYISNFDGLYLLTGTSGNVALTSGVTSFINVFAVSAAPGSFLDNQVYQPTVIHTLTLNGVGQSFSQLWTVSEISSPTTSVGGAGPTVYAVPSGTIQVEMLPGSGFTNYQASLLFTEVEVPEPATLVLYALGLAGIGALRRRR